MNDLIALHRYWIWANRSREHFERALSQVAASGELDPDGWFASDVGLFLTRWYAALFVVIEGWRELQLLDARVDSLLASPHVEHLRRFRHGVCHFQHRYLDDRFIRFASDPGTVPWVRDLTTEFGRYFVEALAQGQSSGSC